MFCASHFSERFVPLDFTLTTCIAKQTRRRLLQHKAQAHCDNSTDTVNVHVRTVHVHTLSLHV